MKLDKLYELMGVDVNLTYSEFIGKYKGVYKQKGNQGHHIVPRWVDPNSKELIYLPTRLHAVAHFKLYIESGLVNYKDLTAAHVILSKDHKSIFSTEELGFKNWVNHWKSHRVKNSFKAWTRNWSNHKNTNSFKKYIASMVKNKTNNPFKTWVNSMISVNNTNKFKVWAKLWVLRETINPFKLWVKTAIYNKNMNEFKYVTSKWIANRSRHPFKSWVSNWKTNKVHQRGK